MYSVNAPISKAAAPNYAARPRQTLTEAQRCHPLLRLAFERINQEAEQRAGRYLRRLDSIHASGSRTHQQTWDALKALSGPILARMDIASRTLGWLDSKGQFHLNRQKGLAEDSNLTDSRVSRTFKALDRAGYTRREMKRLHEQGRWITRVTIRLTRQFFTDLGLAHVLAKASARKQAQQQRVPQAAAPKRPAHSPQKAPQPLTQSHPQPTVPLTRRYQPTAANTHLNRQRTELTIALRSEHPELTGQQIIDLVNQHYPIT